MCFQDTRKAVGHYSYLLSQSIGDGSSSTVYKGTNQLTKQMVSIKVVPKLHHHSLHSAHLASSEIHALRMLKDSPNILPLAHSVQTKNSIYIITPLCEKGTLGELIRKEGRIDEARAIRILLQIVNGYRSIHLHNLIHRDIKPSNIFLTASEQVMIGDFGFAVDAGECQNGPAADSIGSPHYMPYEALAENRYSYKSDIWAIGVTFFEMLTGRIPWKSRTEKELKAQLQTVQPHLFLPQQFSERTAAFLRRALEKDLDKRMAPQQLFAFSFYTTNPSLPFTTTKSIRKSSKSKLNRTLPANLEQSTLTGNIGEHGKQNQVFKENKLTVNSGETLSKAEHFLMNFKKTQKSKQAYDGQTQRRILLVVQAQINYFRFMFKLSRRMQETLKTNDPTIRQLKEHILFLAHQLITQIQYLQHLPFPSIAVQAFQQTQEHHNLQKILHQYQQRYRQKEQKMGLVPTRGQAPLPSLLVYTAKVLYQNISKIQQDQEELKRKEALVFILQDLLHFHQLTQLHQHSDWQSFQEHSSIDSILEGRGQKQEVGLQWGSIRKRVRELLSK